MKKCKILGIFIPMIVVGWYIYHDVPPSYVYIIPYFILWLGGFITGGLYENSFNQRGG